MHNASEFDEIVKHTRDFNKSLCTF